MRFKDGANHFSLIILIFNLEYRFIGSDKNVTKKFR